MILIKTSIDYDEENFGCQNYLDDDGRELNFD